MFRIQKQQGTGYGGSPSARGYLYCGALNCSISCRRRRSSISCSLLFLLIMFLVRSPLHADPWGKDSDLARQEQQACPPPKNTCKTPLFGTFAELMIRFHQKVVSPIDGPRSHFIPSSSQYTLDAMRKYGFFIGLTKGCDRLMRENKEEWVYGWTVDGAGNPIKYDPVR